MVMCYPDWGDLKEVEQGHLLSLFLLPSFHLGNRLMVASPCWE